MGLMNEYIERKMSASELEDELIRLIKEYNAKRETYLFLYASAIGKPIPDISLTMDDYYAIYDMLNSKESKQLDFYIETPGGSGEAAEEIGRFIRSEFENVNFLISGEAKSAGTILALSGNEILMTKSGSLGPIDAQMKIGRSMVSAYDYREWVEEKRKEANRTRALNPFDAIMVAQISPGELKLVNHSLEFAKDLVIDWLAKYKFKEWTKTENRQIPVTEAMKKNRAKEIATELSNHARWRSHGRSLKINDLENIGLKIFRVDDDPDLSDIVYKIQTITRLLFISTSTYKIFATEDEKLLKQAVEMNAPPTMPNQFANQAKVVEFEISCSKCGEKYKMYAKLVDDPNIDDELQKKEIKPFPHDNKLLCDCGFEIDLSGIRNEIETTSGKKIII